ncbi:protein of unknown function [Paraburkholderia kururiensis]
MIDSSDGCAGGSGLGLRNRGAACRQRAGGAGLLAAGSLSATAASHVESAGLPHAARPLF